MAALIHLCEVNHVGTRQGNTLRVNSHSLHILISWLRTTCTTGRGTLASSHRRHFGGRTESIQNQTSAKLALWPFSVGVLGVSHPPDALSLVDHPAGYTDCAYRSVSPAGLCWVRPPRRSALARPLNQWRLDTRETDRQFGPPRLAYEDSFRLVPSLRSLASSTKQMSRDFPIAKWPASRELHGGN